MPDDDIRKTGVSLTEDQYRWLAKDLEFGHQGGRSQRIRECIDLARVVEEVIGDHPEARTLLDNRKSLEATVRQYVLFGLRIEFGEYEIVHEDEL